jgi:hypothetical protein
MHLLFDGDLLCVYNSAHKAMLGDVLEQVPDGLRHRRRPAQSMYDNAFFKGYRKRRIALAATN